MHAYVILNETHALTPEQRATLNSRFSSWELKLVPEGGWTVDQQRGVARSLLEGLGEEEALVFASPVPLLLAVVAWELGAKTERGAGGCYSPYVFVRETRSSEEWRLVTYC